LDERSMTNQTLVID